MLRLGDYVLVERIGEGGMAEVFRARFIGRPTASNPGGSVVIKRIRPYLFSQPEFPIFREMFLNEARLVRKLSHPNLARVFSLHEARDPETGMMVPFIVGELVEGRELWALMRIATRGFSGHGVPPAIAAYVVREAALGLGHAHAHRDGDRAAPIIHRDVSPENILISNEGEVKIIDFGVAKALGGFGPQTRTGIIKGKLSYMAPEQVAQRALPATDVFGAGIVLWELLTGRRLFGGPNDFMVIQRVLKARIPPPTAYARVPEALSQVVMRALERDLARRYPDGNALALALTETLQLPGLRGTDPWTVVRWVQGLERPRRQRRGSGERGSDLHVDIDQVLLEAGNGRADERLFGSLPGPVDPGVRAAVTQAMQTLQAGGSDRAETTQVRPHEPAVPRWAYGLLGLLLVLSLVLLGLILKRKGHTDNSLQYWIDPVHTLPAEQPVGRVSPTPSPMASTPAVMVPAAVRNHHFRYSGCRATLGGGGGSGGGCGALSRSTPV
jgi:serine/threonine protein kinase